MCADHGREGPRRVGEQHDDAAAGAEPAAGLAGRLEGARAVVHHAPDVDDPGVAVGRKLGDRGRIGMAGRVMPPHLEQFGAESTPILHQARQSSCAGGDDLVLHQLGAAEQRAFAEQHAEAQDARQQPVVLDAADDQASGRSRRDGGRCRRPARARRRRQAVEEHRRVELDECETHRLQPSRSPCRGRSPPRARSGSRLPPGGRAPRHGRA